MFGYDPKILTTNVYGIKSMISDYDHKKEHIGEIEMTISVNKIT